jgi:E3 ubiquitin-protein ligase RNF5
MGERMAATKKFPDGRMRMSSSSHNQHDEENNPQTEINTGLRKRPAHTEETRNTDNDSSVEKRTNASLFDCHICFDSPNDPVVTPCGHLYCWSCIYKWMVAHPECPSCPLCKSSIDKDKIIPIYGRNEEDKVDPRTKHVLDNNIPARPSGHRTEIPPRPSSSTTTGGTAAYHLPHSPYYGNPFYSGPFSSAVHHSNFGPFSVSAFGPFPSLFGLQFTYPPPPSSHVSSQNGASVAEGMTEEQANQAFVSRLLLVMGLLIILCLLFV